MLSWSALAGLSVMLNFIFEFRLTRETSGNDLEKEFVLEIWYIDIYIDV